MSSINPNFVPFSTPIYKPPSSEDKSAAVVKNEESVETSPAVDPSYPKEEDLETFLAIQTGITDVRTSTADTDTILKHEKQQASVNQMVETGAGILDTISQSASDLQESLSSSTSSLEAGDVIDLFNLPLVAVQLTTIKDNLNRINQALRAKKEEAATLLSSPPSPERDAQSQILQKKLEELKMQKAQLKQGLVQSSFGLAQSVFQAGDAVTSLANTIEQEIKNNSSPLLEAAASGSAVSVGIISLTTGTVSLIQDGHEYHALSQKLVEMEMNLQALKSAGQEQSEEYIQCEKEITKLNEKMDLLRGKLVDNSVMTARSLINTLGSAADLIQNIAPQLSQAASTALSTTALAAPIVAGALGTVISAKQIADNASEAAKINGEIDKLQAELLKTNPAVDPVVREIILMKLKNLEFQKENNIVSTMRSSIALFAGALGTTSGAIALTGVTTAGVVLAGTTAGIGAAAVAGLGISIGGGYYIYKNRLYIATKAQILASDTKTGFIKHKIKTTDTSGTSKQEKVQKKVAVLAKQLSQIREEKRKLQEDYATEVAPLLSSLHEKTTALVSLEKLKTSLEAYRNSIDSSRYSDELTQVRSEVGSITSEIAALKAEIAPINARVEELSKQSVETSLTKTITEQKLETEIITQLESVNQTNAKIVGLLGEKEKETMKSKMLVEKLENRALNGQLRGSSTTEVAAFKEHLSLSLNDPEKAEEIRKFLETQGIEQPDIENLSQSCLGFLTKAA